MAIEGVESADLLTVEQRRDTFYGNAARRRRGDPDFEALDAAFTIGAAHACCCRRPPWRATRRPWLRRTSPGPR